MKVIIGAGKTHFDGWISTQEIKLKLLLKSDFDRLFAGQKASVF